MKKNEVKIGGTYTAKVSDKIVNVRIDAENPHGGWNATNLATNRKVRIKSAAKLRSVVSPRQPAQSRVSGETAASADTKSPSQRTATRAEQGDKKAEKLSCLDAAVRVLTEADGPLGVKEMIDAMAAKGYWRSPGGKTPHATLYAAILRELKTKGAQSRFKKTGRGKFTVNA